MTKLTAQSVRLRPRSLAFAALFLAALLPLPAAAQCTLTGTINQFEPNVPGPGGPRPSSLSQFLSIAGFYPFQSGTGVRLLVQESFGYSILDLTSRANPQVLGYEDYRTSPSFPGPIQCNGDCHSSIGGVGVSADGQRAIFSQTDLAAGSNGGLQVLVGQASGNNWGFTLAGDMAPRGPSGILVQNIGATYFAWTFASDGVRVADATGLPGLAPNSLTSHLAGSLPGNGYLASISGYWITYTDGPNVYLVNASNPLPASSLTAQTFTAGSFGRPTDQLAAYFAAQDPADTTAVYIIGEFRTGSAHGGWTVIRVKSGQATVVGTLHPAAGETNVYAMGLGADSTGNLFAAMWVRTASGLNRLYSSPVATFGGTSGFFDATGVGAGHPTLVAGTGPGEMYAYIPGGSAGWVVPMTCVSRNAPATSSLAVTNVSAGGATVASGDPVFLGDLLAIAPVVNPSPLSQPLTGFGWNFDFDFHTGSAVEDAGTSVHPRIINNDNATLGSPANPPATISLVGPCDPKTSGDPLTGAGCWNSVKTNSAQGGPDFTGAETAGAVKPLVFAIEANNQYGTGGAALFTVNWKIPAAKLASTQVLSGQPLVSGSDGHPTASGFKWYFGDTPTTLALAAGCTGTSCAPTGPAAVKGTHSYWLTASYANGYATADYAGTAALGTYTITDFAPAFTVNGSTTSATTVINQNLTVLNSSQRGALVTAAGGFSYSFCIAPCADNYVGWGTMGDAPPGGSPPYSATIPVPGVVGNYVLKIKVIYTGGGTAFWPDPTGATGFPVSVIQVFPEIWFHDSCGFGCSDKNSLATGTGTVLAAWAYSNGIPDTVTQNLTWSAPGGTPSSGSGRVFSLSYNTPGSYTLTLNGYPSPVTATVTVTGPPPSPLSVTSVTATPSIVSPNASVSFACSATGGTGSGNYSYSWGFSDGGSAGGQFPSRTFASPGTYTATCTVSDGQSTAAGSTAVTVTGGSTGSQQIWFKDSCGFGCSDKGSIAIGTGASLNAWAYVNSAPDTTTAGLTWYAPGGTPASGSGRTFAFTYNNPGTYTLTLNGYSSPVTAIVTVSGPATGGGCTAFGFDVKQPDGTSAKTISAPGAGGGGSTFTSNVGSNLTFTQNSGTAPTSWLWDFGDNSTATTQTPQHAYTHAGIYTITLTIPSASGTAQCTTSNTITLTGPSGDFTPQYNGDNTPFVPTNVAPNKNVLFTASDPTTAVSAYLWDFGDGSAHATGKTAVHAFSPGPWTVTLTVTAGTVSVSTTLALTVAEEPKWVVAGMAYVNGQVPGTVWQSDVTISNPDKTNAANYGIAFLDANNPVDDGSKLSWINFTVPPLGSAESSNLLHDVFGQALGAYGALMVRGDLGAMAPVITARTFNNGDASKGTFGLSVPPAAVSTGGVTVQAAPAASLLIGLRQDEKAYTNLGLVNLSNEWPKVKLDFLDGASGALLVSKNVDLMPYQSAQISRVLQATGYANSSDLFTVKVSIVPQAGSHAYAVYPFATVIDAGTTDPIVVTPTVAPSSSYRIPGIVRLTGAHGERWRSRVTITNPSSASRKVTLSFSYVPCRAGTCFSRITVPLDVKMAPGQTQSWDDVVNVWLTYGAGNPADDAISYQSSFLDVQPSVGDTNTDPLVVLGETYNDTSLGHVGLQIPGYLPTDGAKSAGSNKRLVLTGLASTTAYRTNLALFVVAGSNGKGCSVHRYSSEGVKLGDDISLSIDGFAQIDAAAGLPQGLDLSRMTVVVDGLEDGVTLAGYATIIDNTSGDSTFVKAQPVP